MQVEDEFDITWEVDDGYAGPSRPQHYSIDVNVLDDEMTADELEELYNEIVMEEFMQNISAYGSNKREFIEWAKHALEARKAEEDEDE